MKKAQAGLKASNKRVGPVDPMGAWTKVQMMNLPPRNVKTKVSLTKDKEQGATSMTAKGGKKIAKAKGGKWIQSAIKKPGALRSALGVKKLDIDGAMKAAGGRYYLIDCLGSTGEYLVIQDGELSVGQTR